MITKKTSRPKPGVDQSAELKAEYRFDYSKAQPNRFAASGRGGAMAVVIDPDVARVFTNGESVNAALRAILAAVPSRRNRETR
jgi:hypothetical protein